MLLNESISEDKGTEELDPSNLEEPSPCNGGSEPEVQLKGRAVATMHKVLSWLRDRGRGWVRGNILIQVKQAEKIRDWL